MTIHAVIYSRQMAFIHFLYTKNDIDQALLQSIAYLKYLNPNHKIYLDPNDLSKLTLKEKTFLFAKLSEQIYLELNRIMHSHDAMIKTKSDKDENKLDESLSDTLNLNL